MARPNIKDVTLARKLLKSGRCTPDQEIALLKIIVQFKKLEVKRPKRAKRTVKVTAPSKQPISELISSMKPQETQQ